MTFTSTSDCLSIFDKDGKLKSGIYKIQSLYNETFVDIQELSRELCCRSGQSLGEGRGLWEIKPLEAGYTIRRVDPGKPAQFSAPMAGLDNNRPLSVSAYPIAWRVEVVNDALYHGCEYVRIYWGITDILWDVLKRDDPHSKVGVWKECKIDILTWIWKLIPVKVENLEESSTPSSEMPGPDPLPSYNGSATGQSSHTQHAESERDDFGTIVTEVTIITTRKRYRVQDAS